MINLEATTPPLTEEGSETARPSKRPRLAENQKHGHQTTSELGPDEPRPSTSKVPTTAELDQMNPQPSTSRTPMDNNLSPSEVKGKQIPPRVNRNKPTAMVQPRQRSSPNQDAPAEPRAKTPAPPAGPSHPEPNQTYEILVLDSDSSDSD